MQVSPHNIEPLALKGLTTHSGQSYSELRKTLTPKYGVVARDLGLGYLALLVSMGASWWYGYFSLTGVLIVPVLALLIGLSFAFIQLFIHEAAHYGLAKDKSKNDLLANIFVSSLVGQSIKSYRKTHWIHHKNLGTPEDSERSYFEALNFKFIFESLTGIKVLKVLLARSEAKDKAGQQIKDVDTGNKVGMLLFGLAIHSAIVLAGVLTGRWLFSFTWIIAIGLIFPFFGAIRQLIEHRDVDASAEVSYYETPHGKYTRMFKDGPLTRILGGAGFNNHLLHHWDPFISYTRLDDIEAFLMQTDYAEAVAQSKTTYPQAFKDLFGTTKAASEKAST